MANWVSKLIVSILLILSSAYFVAKNGAPISVQLWSSKTIEVQSGVALLVAFLVGMLCASVIGLFFGLRSYLRERALLAQDERRQSYLKTIASARSMAAIGKPEQALTLWEKVIQKEPNYALARIELAKALQQLGRPAEALKALDEARIKEPENLEVLFTAATLNDQLGNKTAAIDNLAIVLYHNPSKRAAEYACKLSEELERFQDALEYHARVRQLESSARTKLLSKEESERRWIDTQARLELKLLEKEHPEKSSENLPFFRQLARKYPDSPAVNRVLAAREKSLGNIEQAAQVLVAAAGKSRELPLWLEASELWTENNKPDRAIATLKSAVNECKTEKRVQAEIALIRLLMRFEIFDECQQRIERVLGELQENSKIGTQQDRFELNSLLGLSMIRQGQIQRGSQLLEQLVKR